MAGSSFLIGFSFIRDMVSLYISSLIFQKANRSFPPMLSAKETAVSKTQSDGATESIIPVYSALGPVNRFPDSATVGSMCFGILV